MIRMKRILVPTDFSEPGKSALQYAVAFADLFGAAVDLLHVVEPVPSGALLSYISKEELHRDMVEQAKKQMEELHTEWQDYAFPVTQTIVDGHPFVEIVKHARENEVDLIIMGTHGRGAISHR